MNETLELRRVKYLYEAVVRGSVRAAADTLDMHASVVSRQIAKLEAELSMPLIERHGRGVKPTEAGELLVEYFRAQNSHQDDLLTKVQELRGLARGHIDLVLGEGFVSDLMAEPIRAFWQRYPGLTVTMRLAGTNEVMRSVAEDAAHIGLVYNPPVAPGIRSRAAVRQPMCVITRPGHPLTELKRQPLLRQVGAYPVALMHGSFGTRQVIALAEQMERVQLVPKLISDSISVIKHFVRADLGVSLLPAFAVAQEVDAGELVALPVDQALLGAAEAHIITRLGRQLSIASNQLLLQLIGTMRAFEKPRARRVGN
ncbi:LysR family transcriptional regulator [Pseudacidovorax intermedius]|uniref:LysR family transcriptional regulator n=1 Tax=Pseudacidovorax intermedius TaxID=433924 RepID=A0A147GQL4_9BURK|nr:LysR family transcriptional regulator [Pseudacidovorax intermedius]KTT18044.1 LysR family transcriptional regulator [Pseudacidovorax intermedius]